MVPDELVEILGAARVRQVLAGLLDEARSLRGHGGTIGAELDITRDVQAQGFPRITRRRHL